MKYDVRLERISRNRPTAVVRRRALPRELPKIIPETCGVVWNVIRTQQIQGAGRHIALYLDDEMNLEVGVELEAPFSGHGEVVGSELPSGDVATTTHFGPYNQLKAAHEAIREWCARHGRTPAGPGWEIYDHWQDAWNRDPSQIRTEVFHLLKPATGKQA